MRGQTTFEKRVEETLKQIGDYALRYDEDEFWMLERHYVAVEEYAREHELFNTAIALPVVRALHNGTHRKSSVIRDGVSYRLPYVIHCIQVCRMLINVQAPLEKEHEDILLAAALCHDVIEDIPFPQEGREMTEIYHLDKRVYETVKTLSKRKDFTEEEHTNYFKKIQENPLALLVKLSDRGNNVEDLYNMSVWKIHEYIEETRSRFYPMCIYANEHYPELAGSISILKEKVDTLIEIAEILVDRHEEQLEKLNNKLTDLRLENQKLRDTLKELEG